MGYPDIIALPKEIEKILGARIYKLKYRDDSAEIQKWHRVEHKIPDAHSFFELQGVTLDVFDVAQHRGGEIVCDLNYQLGYGLTGSSVGPLGYYDFVLDIGTLEHCFNIGQAAINMVWLLKQGGIILHENPFNQGNHGFYNINPTWYADFYGQEGFELLELGMIARNCAEAGKQVPGILKTKRFRYMDSEANMVAIAKRVKVLPVGYPVQSKYKTLIPAAGVSGEQMKEVAHG